LLTGRKLRFNFAVYDIETPGIDSLDFHSCGFYDGEKYWYFRSMVDFLSHALKKEYAGWRFFAHFGGRFDVHYVWDFLRKNFPQTYMEVNCAGSCVISLTVRQGKNRWRFCDSYRLLPKSLATLTHDFDVKHKKLTGRAFTDRTYNEYDCRGLYEVLEIFFDEFEICSETIASHAMRVFRSKFLSKDLYQPHREVEDFCRDSYAGGRCEIYRYDKAEVKNYDVNSLFPSAMQQPVPVRYLYAAKKLYNSSRRVGFYRATVKYPLRYLPLLPYHSGKLFFPVGTFNGTFTAMELERALADGAEVKIHEGRVFSAAPIFAEFAETLYKMKSQAEHEGLSGKRYIYKIVSNSLYGKWGQRREQKRYFIDDGRAGVFPLPNGLCYEEMESRSAHIRPDISSVITSRARLRQYDLLSRAQNWYTDTDSLFTKSEYPVSNALGGLHFEGAGTFQAFRLKEYFFRDSYKIKGLPRSKNEDEAARKKEDQELAEKYLGGQAPPNTRMRGWTESMRAGLDAVGRVTMTRRPADTFDKRARDGAFDTRPWDVKELACML
jgi:hypothetical protein